MSHLRSYPIEFAAVLIAAASAVVSAQTVKTADQVPISERLSSSNWALPHVETAPFVLPPTQPLLRDGAAQFGENVIVQSGPDRRGFQHFDAVRDAPAIPAADGFRLSAAATTRRSGFDRTRHFFRSRDAWEGGWGGVYGGRPIFLYPDDVILSGSRRYYGPAALNDAFNAGKDAGRRETLFRGALDTYNERMGTGPTGTADDDGVDERALVAPRYTPAYGADAAFLDSYLSGKSAGAAEGALWLARDRHLLRTATTAIDDGLVLFRAGRYQEALDAFRLAASADHGDAAARILCGHAYFALGQHRNALNYVRRGFQLQPRITFLNYDMRRDYGEVTDFDKQLDALKKAAADRNNDYTLWALLGYVHRYSDDRTAATEALSKAYKIEPRDRLVRSLLDVDPDPRH